MDIRKLMRIFRPKPKLRPVKVGDAIVGYDDGLPNTINIDKASLRKALTSYGTEDYGFFTELWALGLASIDGDQRVFTRKVHADRSIFVNMGNVGGVSTGGAYVQARSHLVWYSPREATYYWCCVETARATDDLGLYKTVNGSVTRLAGWATDIDPDKGTTLLDLCTKATTIEVWTYDWNVTYDWLPDKRPNEISGSNLRIQVTDSSIAEGLFGYLTWGMRYGQFTSGISYWPNAWNVIDTGILRPPSASPSLKPLAYFEVPVEFFDLPEVDDEGNVNITRQYYGVKLPSEIAYVKRTLPPFLKRKYEILKARGWKDEEIRALMPEAYPYMKVNKLALSYSALIPTDNKGKPKDAVALLRVYESSPSYLHSIERRVQALKEMRGVRRLSREEAIRTALKMDDKLHIHDLVPCTKHELGGKCFKEYREWRIGSVGEKEEFADTDIRKRYVKTAKGW